MDRFASLIEKIRIIHTKEELDSLISVLLLSKKPLVLSFLNAHAMTIAQKNEDFFRNLMAADILLRDGVGIAIGMKSLGFPSGMNMNGTDFIPLLLSCTPRSSIGVYGTRSPWLESAIKQLDQKHDVISQSDGFQPDQHYTCLYLDRHPEIVLLGMGMPKQERIAIQIKTSALDSKALIINGGAVLDFMAARVKRAPAWIQRCRMEWFFRLLQEPQRLLGRYTIGIVKFFYYLIRCKFYQCFHRK